MYYLLISLQVTVVHAPTLGSGSQTLEIAPKSAMAPLPATVKPQGVTMPVTIRHQASAIKTNLSPGMANSPIQLVPISTGGMARPNPVPARHTLKTTNLRAATPILESPHSVRVTLLQSPATITKITSTQSGIPSKAATIVGSVGPQVCNLGYLSFIFGFQYRKYIRFAGSSASTGTPCPGSNATNSHPHSQPPAHSWRTKWHPKHDGHLVTHWGCFYCWRSWTCTN